METALSARLIEGLASGDRLSLSKGITLVESQLASQQPDRIALIEWALQQKKESFRLAVTGVPGAGKSTLIDLLGLHWIKQNHKVAVLAVDPSSSASNGSILGDKTRMVNLAKEENAFVRPSPTRLNLGGLAATTFETILLCEAAGYDRIIVETVGVGQSETVASQLTDCCVLLLVAGTGDDLQGVKKGILETADIVWVNKADGDNALKAKSFARELKSISTLWALRQTEEPAQIAAGSSLDLEHIQPLAQLVEDFRTKVSSLGYHNSIRHRQLNEWMKHFLLHALEKELFENQTFQDRLSTATYQILQNKQSVSSELEALLGVLTRSQSSEY